MAKYKCPFCGEITETDRGENLTEKHCRHWTGYAGVGGRFTSYYEITVPPLPDGGEEEPEIWIPDPATLHKIDRAMEDACSKKEFLVEEETVVPDYEILREHMAWYMFITEKTDKCCMNCVSFAIDPKPRCKYHGYCFYNGGEGDVHKTCECYQTKIPDTVERFITGINPKDREEVREKEWTSVDGKILIENPECADCVHFPECGKDYCHLLTDDKIICTKGFQPNLSHAEEEVNPFIGSCSLKRLGKSRP